MKLIVGLGNPGIRYASSRHNIGFRIVKSLAKIYKIPLKRDRGTLSLSGRSKIEGEEVILSLPLTYMNLSGNSVSAALRKYKIDLSDLLVICDDLDLDLGRLKIRPSGSSGGHRGLNSIIEFLHSQDFNRLRIGIGRPKRKLSAQEYVLLNFSAQEKKILQAVINTAIDCSSSWISNGINKTMTIFNTQEKKIS